MDDISKSNCFRALLDTREKKENLFSISAQLISEIRANCPTQKRALSCGRLGSRPPVDFNQAEKYTPKTNFLFLHNNL